jgi:trehalose/maltose hydrolase-like predicted phosphorylase
MRTGTAVRAFGIRDALGRHTHIRESRLVSMDCPRLCAGRYQFTPLDWSGTVEFRSALEGDVLNDNVKRYEDYSYLHLVDHANRALSSNEALLQCSTSRSRIRIAQAMRNVCSEPNASIDTV